MTRLQNLFLLFVLLACEAQHQVAVAQTDDKKLPPGPCRDFKVTDVTNSSITVTWVKPEVTNGPLKGYLLYANKRPSNIDPTLNRWTVEDLKPWTDFLLKISAFNSNDLGPSVTASAKTLISAPPEPLAFLKVSEEKKDQASLNIPQDMFSSENGPIMEYILLVKLSKHEEMTQDTGFGKVQDANFPSWDQAGDRSVWYRSSPEKWDFTKDKEMCSAAGNGKLKCVIGQQKTCDNVKYCNGPLKPKQDYWAKIRGYTDVGWAETLPIYFVTGSSTKLTSGIACLIMYPLFKILL